MINPTVIAVTIFLIVYAFIITEKIHRSVIAMLGASAILLLGILDTKQAFYHHIDWETITLLIGMMILVGIINTTGVFQYLAVRAAKLAKGQPIRILILLSLLTAGLSAFLDNVTTVLLIVPVTFSITNILKVKSTPFLIAEILASNIGGTATLIGDPPNIMIGSSVKHLTFNDFLINLAPVIIIIMAVISILFYFIYRNQLKADAALIEKLMDMDEKSYIENPSLMKKSIVVLILTIVSFMLHSVIHVDPSTIAISAAAVLLLIGVKEKDIEKVFGYVEWPTIFFFAGLFILVGALQEVGVIKFLATKALAVTGGDLTVASLLILWVSGITSAFIDNIPYVATMIPLIKDMIVGLGLPVDSIQADTLWWSLALGACLGGNGTIIGASANVVVSGIAAREGKGFNFVEFFKIGFPIMIVTLIISHLYIYFRYLIHLS